MKKISKLGLISVLCLVLVIGGVFATWNYSQNTAKPADPKTVDIVITEAVSDTEKGVIAITSVPKLTLDDTNNDHIAELVITNDLEITFTADANADKAVYASGIPMVITFTSTLGQYKDEDVIVIAQATVDIATSDLQGGNGTFTYTITAADLKNYLTVGTVSLPTYDDYNDFKTTYLPTAGSIKINVAEKIA